MSADFPAFGKLVNESFKKLVAGQVFEVNLAGDDLWATYLASFPEGTNLIYKKRTEHDCSCCKQFIRRAGLITDGVTTVWEEASKNAPAPYNIVAKKMHDTVIAQHIKDLYVVNEKEGSFGVQQSHSLIDGTAMTWSHFYTDAIPANVRSKLPDTKKGEHKSAVQVFERGLKELAPSAIETVLSLIGANNLYRGEEHKPALEHFTKAQREYSAAKNKELYCWKNASGPASRFRNSVIGTLVVDLSEGKDVDQAVRAFEKKVAPENYKRTSAVITQGMIDKAMETIRELDLEPALERRFARIDDISVNDVKWVDTFVRPLMKGGIGDMLKAQVKVAPVDTEKAEKISVDAFLGLLPEASSVEVFFKNKHTSNLVSLTAPVHPEPKQLFKWDNDFAWSYNGNIADSAIRQAVQSRGGRVDGVFRFSHSWNHDKRNASLMDLHVFMPGNGANASNGTHDAYGNHERVGWNHRNHPASGGTQDVDYTQPAPAGYIPVENITFPTLSRMKDGKYICKIHNWQLRPPTEGGFRAEIEFDGQLFEYEYEKPLKHKEWITVATVTLSKGQFSIEHHLPCGSVSQDRWGMKTEKFIKVNAITLSPNYWGTNKVGNRHLFFFLEGAKNDESTRGIYNEFLHARLEAHRKVFEVIGDKTKCQPTEGQLSGLGFSSTKKDSFIVKLSQGKRQRLLEVENV